MSQTMQKFLSRFSFSPDTAGLVGVEREYMLYHDERPVPRSEDFLRLAAVRSISSVWKPEMSACQVENVTPPRRLEDVENALSADADGDAIAQELGLRLVRKEVAPEGMPLDLYPAERYLRISAKISEERLKAAFRVMGTHIHVGCSDILQALEVYNRLRQRLSDFCSMGASDGERLRLYKLMAPDWYPPEYSSPESFFQAARACGFLDDPRSCYHFIRLNPVGTVEVRAFGIAPIERTMEWVSAVHECAGF